ncbi:MAG TPA: DNA polymerase/3'-5' exonuclease PolX [Polyangia bacterium]|nr:DNA polymerase/3'-5' exonuclease PolX [Polyangia bacterium]
MLDRFAIARALREIASLLELKGENPFRARAYDNGARSLEKLTDEELARLVDEKRLTEVKGIGTALAALIAELFLTGHSAFLDELRAALPPGLIELAQVPDLGPRKIQALHEALGITSVAALKAACEAGQVRGLKGFGEKSEEKILEGIQRYETREERMLLVHALELGEPLLAHVRACPAVHCADLAGSARRWKETVADLDIVAGSLAPTDVMDHFASHPSIERVEARGDTKCTVRLGTGFQVDLRVVPPVDYGTALHHFTGSKDHHVRLRGLARERGLTVSEWGVVRLESGDKLEVPSEEALYQQLGLPYIPPELRENEGEIEAALAGERFDDLVRLEDIQGMVHCHTTFSDGKNSIEEMARAAEAMGMKYLTITDHSPTAAYAGGVKFDDLLRQWDEIARVQEKVKVRLLRGTESDILEDGALDYPDAVLEKFDVIIASIHSRMRMDEDQMTRRLIGAMRQPWFKIWGHALGRLIQKRDPFACRVEEVLDVVADSRAAVEINGDPYRLDMEPRWIREARRRGIRFVISTDAHSVDALRNLRFGVGIARRGGVRRSEVINVKDAEGFRREVRPS